MDKPIKNEKIARRARVACEKWRGYFKQNIDLYHFMNNFVMGQQWTPDEEDDMIKTFRKTPLVANHLGAMNNTLLGEQQQNTPQIQVKPKGNCDEETAQIRELVTKDIMFSNDSKSAYQTVAQQIGMCMSAFKWSTDYNGSKSFDQDLCISAYKDPTRTYFDISANHPNKIDGEFCGDLTRMSRKKFRNLHGKNVEETILKTSNITQSKEEIALSVQPTQDNSDDPFNWADDEAITIINHYERSYKKSMLYKMSNGQILNKEELDEVIKNSRKINKQKMMEKVEQMIMQAQQPEQPMQQEMQGQNPEQQPQDTQGYGMQDGNDLLNPNQEMEQPVQEEIQEEDDFMTLWMDDEPVHILDKKEHKESIITCYQIAGDYILDKTIFPSSEYLPIIFVAYSSYYDKAGKQICRSFWGDAKDTQRYVNYLRTQSAYILKSSRYDQWMVSKKNVASLDTQRMWRDPNALQGALIYDESERGNKPEQIKPPELSQSLFTQYQLAVDDLHRLTGLYEARMGNAGDEASGKAQELRTRQGSYATFVYFNAINQAITAGGLVVNEMIPKVYDAERVLSLMTPDGRKSITVNKRDVYGNITNDIRKGEYQVLLVAGPSYEGQKQEYLESLREVLQIDPTSFNMVADLYADNLPLANNIEIRNRLKTRVPPEIIEAGKTGQMPKQHGPSPEQQAMQMQQQQMQIDAQVKEKELQLKEQELQLKHQELMMEYEFKNRELETEKLQVAGELQEQELRYAAESERTEVNKQIAHADNLVKILTHKVDLGDKEKND